MKTKSFYTVKGEDLRTAKEWLKIKMIPVEDAIGETLWTNGYHQYTAAYYRANEVRLASQDEFDAAMAPERERRRQYEHKRYQKQKIKRLLEKAKHTPIAPLENHTGIVCLDIETTGLDPDKDELLQISIIDGNANVLLNTYIKPYKAKRWPKAQAINNISPEMVAMAPELHSVLPQIYAALASARIIVGYNLAFDLSFLPWIPDHINYDYVDVMLKFAEIYGEWSDYFNNYKWQSLTTCAAYYGYTFNAHNSLDDAKATLFCYLKIKDSGIKKRENH